MINKETLEEAANKWVFETNGHKWSNNDDTAGDNHGSFKSGAEWMVEQMESLKDFETWKEWKNKSKVDIMRNIDYYKMVIEMLDKLYEYEGFKEWYYSLDISVEEQIEKDLVEIAKKRVKL